MKVKRPRGATLMQSIQKAKENSAPSRQDEPVCPICGSSAHKSCEFWAEFSAWWDSQPRSMRLDEIPGIVAWEAWQRAASRREAGPSEREVFSKVIPAEQGWYWHWNGEHDIDPMPTSVMKSLTNGKCFVSAGQLGLELAVDCGEYDGLWCKMSIPVPVHALAQPPTPNVVPVNDDSHLALIVGPLLREIYGDSVELGHYKAAIAAYKLGISAAAEIALAQPPTSQLGNAAELAQLFHETYERLAPKFGYKTREASAKPWAEVPEQNKQLMIAVCGEILASSTWVDVQAYAIAVSQALSREFGERFPEDKPHIAALIEQTERILRQFD